MGFIYTIEAQGDEYELVLESETKSTKINSIFEKIIKKMKDRKAQSATEQLKKDVLESEQEIKVDDSKQINFFIKAIGGVLNLALGRTYKDIDKDLAGDHKRIITRDIEGIGFKKIKPKKHLVKIYIKGLIANV